MKSAFWLTVLAVMLFAGRLLFAGDQIIYHVKPGETLSIPGPNGASPTYQVSCDPAAAMVAPVFPPQIYCTVRQQESESYPFRLYRYQVIQLVTGPGGTSESTLYTTQPNGDQSAALKDVSGQMSQLKQNSICPATYSPPCLIRRKVPDGSNGGIALFQEVRYSVVQTLGPGLPENVLYSEISIAGFGGQDKSTLTRLSAKLADFKAQGLCQDGSQPLPPAQPTITPSIVKPSGGVPAQ
ncbi:MAG: hypothetical protein HY075_02870 [Deltaproteobacteria bacterium]|nr:hypothetical protein [Deltaproteobacteria bacterium]